jgi:hypothetical protein
MKPKQILNLLGGVSFGIGVLLAFGGSPAWALFAVVGGMLLVVARGFRKG